MRGKVKVWGNVVTVEWADPIEDPDPDIMAKVNQSRQEKHGVHLAAYLQLNLKSLNYLIQIQKLRE